MSEQNNSENSTPTQPLTDLSVTPEQAEETKGGTLSGGGGMGAGKVHVHDLS